MKATVTIIKSLGPQTLLLGILFVATSALAQEQNRPALTDPRIVVIPVRSLEEIHNDIDNVQVARQHAAYREARAGIEAERCRFAAHGTCMRRN